ncbi:MAG: PaaI family thioesterase [Blastocatellia bacterium]
MENPGRTRSVYMRVPDHDEQTGGETVPRQASAGKVTWSPFPALLGMEVVESAPGRATLRLPHAPGLLQPYGVWHGGVVFTLADSASGRAAHSLLDEGRRSVTLEMQINYIGAVRDEACIATATVAHMGQSTMIVEAEVRTESGRMVARALATFAILTPDAAPFIPA